MQGVGPLKRNQSFTLETNSSAAQKLSTLTICMENFKNIYAPIFLHRKCPPTPQKTTKPHTHARTRVRTHKQCVKDLWSLRCLHYKGRHDCIRQINHELKSQQLDWQNCLFFCWVAGGGAKSAAKRLLRSISSEKKGQHEARLLSASSRPLRSASWFPNADLKVMECLKKNKKAAPQA